MRRLVVALALCACVVAVAAPTSGEVLHDPTSQEAFGFDVNGMSVEGVEGVAEFPEAWERFASTAEGARILERLDRQVGYRITIRAVPNSEIDNEKQLHGLSQLKQRPSESQGEIVITLATDAVYGVDNLAETIYHEMRHVELWLDEDFDEGHERLHADRGSGIVTFLEQMGIDPSGLPPEPEPEESTPPAPTRSGTPIHDLMEEQRRSDKRLSYIAEELGDVLALAQFETPTFTDSVIDIEEVILYDGVPQEVADELNSFLGEIEPIEDDAPCARGDALFACGTQPGNQVMAGDKLVGLVMNDMIPLEGFDHSLNFLAVFDADDDHGNNLSATEGFGNDPFQDGDSWFRMFYDHPTDHWSFYSQGIEGDSVNPERPSGALGIIEHDTLWFMVPGSELPGTTPLVRPGVIGFDDLENGVSGVDVLGELGSDPLIGLTGSYADGPPSASLSTPDGAIWYFGPTTVTHGGTLHSTFCLDDSGGTPRSGLEVATTLGLDPSSPAASHNNAVTDNDGCVSLLLDVNEPHGESRLWFFDSFEVHDVVQILIGPSTTAETTGN